MAEDQKLFSSHLISDVQGGYFCFWTLLDLLLPNLREQPDPFSAFSLAKKQRTRFGIFWYKPDCLKRNNKLLYPKMQRQHLNTRSKSLFYQHIVFTLSFSQGDMMCWPFLLLFCLCFHQIFFHLFFFFSPFYLSFIDAQTTLQEIIAIGDMGIPYSCLHHILVEGLFWAPCKGNCNEVQFKIQTLSISQFQFSSQQILKYWHWKKGEGGQKENN